MADVIVIGGGIVGASTAYHLARADVQTLLVDRRDPGRATNAGAGIISPETSRHTSTPWYEFATTAATYYPTLVQDLKDAGITDTGYGQPGAMLVDLSRDPNSLFAAIKQELIDRHSSQNQPSSNRLRQLSPSEAKEYCPPLGDGGEAIYDPTAGRVNGQTFETALLNAAQAEGLELQEGSATQIHLENGSVSGVTVDGTLVSAETVVVAGGAWSPEFAENLDLTLPITPQRGQIIHLRQENSRPQDWPIISTIQGYYLVPWPNGRIAAGATRESNVGFNPQTTAAGINEVLSAALEIAPGLSSAQIDELRVGLRPLSDDGLPFIGETPTVSGAYLATGHGPTGLTLGPYTGRVVSRLIRNEPIDADLTPFDPARYHAG